MNDKEQISTLISVGAGLPPVNPYLDDSTPPEGGGNVRPHKSRAGRKPRDLPTNPSTKVTIAPDPKEYIAELERPEEEGLY